MTFTENLRHWVYRVRYRYGRYLPLRTPVDVSLELASLCTMQCVYCYHAASNAAKLPFKKGLMSWDTACNIITQAAEIGGNSLKFNYRGESTINPNFERITAYAKS